jgi:hypothetical protein
MRKTTNIQYQIFIVLLILALGACRKQANKTASNSPDSLLVATKPDTLAKSPAIKVENLDELLEKEVADIKIAEIDFQYFTSNSRLHFKTPTENQNATINFRIKKDSLIWFSVSGFGLEAVRGIITQDSLIAIDKLHREYYKYDFASLSQNFNFDLNYQLLQSLVLGNLPIKKRGNNKYVRRENDYFLLHQDDGKVLIDNYIGENNRKLKKLQVTKGDAAENRLTMTFDDFQTINEHIFPHESLVTVGYKSKRDNQLYETLIELKHKKVEFSQNPLNFPFVIPKNYQPKQ